MIKIIEDNYFNCKIRQLDDNGKYKLYEIKHNIINTELHALNLAEALRMAKLLELEYVTCTWVERKD